MQQQGMTYQGRLNANAVLNQGESLMGENGSNYRFTCQTDGNLVLKLEYTGGQAEFRPEEYGEFAEFHRKLIGSIEQPMLIE